MAVISSKSVVTRKEHDCWGCARKMPKGSKMEAVNEADNGTISTFYWCEVCQSYWDKHMEQGDEVGFGELSSEDREGWEEVRKTIETVQV
jgi:uncharacterized protein with PIN domain